MCRKICQHIETFQKVEYHWFKNNSILTSITQKKKITTNKIHPLKSELDNFSNQILIKVIIASFIVSLRMCLLSWNHLAYQTKLFLYFSKIMVRKSEHVDNCRFIWAKTSFYSCVVFILCKIREFSQYILFIFDIFIQHDKHSNHTATERQIDSAEWYLMKEPNQP